MPKLRRGGYIFRSWVGDHSPKHVHVYKEGRFVVKWDLENDAPMKGHANARLRRLIDELREGGQL